MPITETEKNTSVGGTIDLAFKHERAYKLFGMQYARCFANMGVKGEFSRPIPARRPMTYTVDFHVEGGCDTILKDFTFAYNKTFNHENKVQTVLHADYVDRVRALTEDPSHEDFSITLVSCKKRPLLTKTEEIDRSRSFFDLHSQDVRFLGSRETSDKDGLITFIMATDQKLSDTQAELVKTTQQNLIDLIGVGTAYVKKVADKDNPDSKFDPKLWEQVFNHLPLMGPSKFTKQTYDKQIVGVEIATDFLKMIIESIVSPEGAALDQFKTFLSNTGKSIKLGISKSSETFKLGVICIVLEAMDSPVGLQLIPKIKSYFINFEQKDLKITSSCSSFEQFTVHFDYSENVAIFNYKALENQSVKTKFDSFIGKSAIDDIVSDADFFILGEV